MLTKSGDLYKKRINFIFLGGKCASFAHRAVKRVERKWVHVHHLSRGAS